MSRLFHEKLGLGWKPGPVRLLSLGCSRLAILCLLPLVSSSCLGSAEHAVVSPSGISDVEKLALLEKMVSEYRGEYPNVPELTVDELLVRLATGNVVLVDVRTETERHVSMLPGAITSDLFGKEKHKHRDQTIVTYCTIGYRSGKYAEQLRQEGFKAYNLHGSILAWVLSGKPVVDSTGSPTWRVHVYGPKWNLLPEGYTPLW